MSHILPPLCTASGRRELSLLYGKFARTVIDFTITALVIFIVLRLIISLKKKSEAALVIPQPSHQKNRAAYRVPAFAEK
jgi:large-conductance mechanosensitive channel